MIAFAAVSVYGQTPPPPSAEILFPSKGQTDIARSFDIVIRLRGAIDTSKLYCKWKEADSTHDDLYRPSVLLMEKSVKDMLQPSGWNRFAASGKFKIINDSTLYLSTPYLEYNTTYTIVIDSLRKLAGGLYARDTCNFTVTKPPHAVTSLSLDGSISLHCNDTITLTFNEPVDSLNTPAGSIVQILQIDTSGYFNNAIPLTTWLDSTHKKVFVRPSSSYILGEPYLFRANTHLLNGDSTNSTSVLFDVKQGFAVYSKPKIIGLPGSPSEHEADSIANYHLADYLYPAMGGKSFLIEENAKIYAQRIVGQYRLVGFESSTDSAMFANLPTNGMQYSQECQAAHDVAFTAVYEIMPKQNIVFRAGSNSTLSVLYNDSTYTAPASDSIQIEMLVDSMEQVAVWATPLTGYKFNGWSSNGSPYNGMTVRTITVKINPAWSTPIWITPVIGLIPTIGKFAYSAYVVVTETNDNDAIGDVIWIQGPRHETLVAEPRTIEADAPDCFEWIGGGDILNNGKTIRRTETTSDPETIVGFTMRRILISLRVEQRVITDATTEELSSKKHILFDGTNITLKEVGKYDIKITKGYSSKYEDPGPVGDEKKPYITVSNLRCGKVSAMFETGDVLLPPRVDKVPWGRYKNNDGYIATTPLTETLWDALPITEANANFTTTVNGRPQKEIRVRELFLHEFKILSIGLNLLQKDNSSFVTRFREFNDVSKNGFSLDATDDGEEGRGSMEYSPIGAEVKLIFNEEIDMSTINAKSLSALAVNGIGGSRTSKFDARQLNADNFGYNGEVSGGVGPEQHLYTFNLKGFHYSTWHDEDGDHIEEETRIAEKMAGITLEVNYPSLTIKSKTGSLCKQGFRKSIVDMEMPEVQLTLRKIYYKHDGDDDGSCLWLCDDYGQVYSYTNGGIVTVGEITSDIYNITSAGNSIKMPAGDYKATQDVNEDPDFTDGKLDDGDPGREINCNRVFAHKAPRVRKTDVLYGFISSWEEDDRDFFKTIARILDSAKAALNGIKADVDKNGTKKDPKDTTNKSLNPDYTVGAVQAGLGFLADVFEAFATPQQEFMGEQIFYGHRRTFFGKYNRSMTEFESQNVIYHWTVDLW